MKKYFTTSLIIFSTIGGIVTFIIASFFTDDIPTLVLFSAIATLSISLTVPTMFAISDRKFKPLIREISEPIVIDERVNYVVGKEVRQGFMITTKNSMFIISTENEKPVKMEIKRNEIKKISITDDVFLNIFLDYDKCIRVFAGNCQELSKMLHDEGFGK